MLTTRNPAEIWPNGSGLSKQAESEIIRIAETEVTPADCQGSGFAPWYAPFYMAEVRWRERQKHKVARAENETDNARKIAQLEKKIAAISARVNVLTTEAMPLALGAKMAGYFSDMSQLTGWYSIIKRLDPARAAGLDPVLKKGFAAKKDLHVPEDVRVALADAVVDVIKLAIRKGVDDALDTCELPRFRGYWNEAEDYAPNDLVSLGGSIWACRQATVTRPSTTDQTWALVVKSGRDGRSTR